MTLQRLIVLLLFFTTTLQSQTNTYKVSFPNAVHHEGIFTLTFPKITSDTLSVRMANSSPGRYAFHSFAKNVYNFKATDIMAK